MCMSKYDSALTLYYYLLHMDIQHSICSTI